MKSLYYFILFILFSNNNSVAADHAQEFLLGNPEISSVNAITFGPGSVLFIGDSDHAMIFALDLSDRKAANLSNIDIKEVDEKLANLLGTEADEVQVNDMAIDPLTANIYLAVSHSSGTPLLFQVVKDGFESVDLTNVKFSKTTLQQAVDKDAKDRRGRSLRQWAIADINYFDGKVMVSGLSNDEFASTLSQINFPFDEKQINSSLEIYHAAHGKFETHAPIKAFIPAMYNGASHIIAGYTCTPLVVFPMSTFEPGKHVKGRTIAELGNWNTPLDMVIMGEEDEQYLLIANSSRALMKISFNDIQSFQDSLTDKIKQRGGTSGVDFINLPFVNVLQLAKMDNENFLMLQREANGDLVLKTGGKRWLSI